MSTLSGDLIDILSSSGVEVIFGFPGETSLPLYVELQKRRGSIRHIVARCPRGAGYMADAYSRITGRLGVADSPGGIGSPFVAPCAHEANNSSVPMLFIASATSTAFDNKWTTSTCNQRAMFDALTKATYRVESAETFASTVKAAIECAVHAPVGPVFLEIPTNLLGCSAAGTRSTNVPPPYQEGAAAWQRDGALDVRGLTERLRRFGTIGVIAGGGCHGGHASEVVSALIEKTGWPFATTLNGKGLLPETHSRSLGVCGAKGLMSANDYLESVECLLVLGSKLGDKSLNHGQFGHDQQFVIHVNNNPDHLEPSRTNYWPICQSIGAFTANILRVDLPSMSQQPIPAQVPFWPPSPTAELCVFLGERLSEGAVVVADASVARGWAGAAIRFSKAGQRLLTPAGSGSLSYALPAAIGAQIARPRAQVVGLGGDGGLLMALHDMETARRLNLPIVFFLLNNNRLGLIDQYAQRLCGGEAVSESFITLDWAHIASGFQWQYVRAEGAADLCRQLPGLDHVSAPTLVEYVVPPTELGPDFLLTLRRKGVAV